jgi:polysaccharide chain length determinant protein (PEP-CTERM system associated)
MSNSVESLVETVRLAVASVRRRRWLAVSIAACLVPAFAVVVTIAPNRYEATSLVYVDTQTVLKPLMSGLTFQPDIDQQVRMLARTLISRPNMLRLVEVKGLHLDDPNPLRREEIITSLMSKIKVTSSGPDNLYEVSYRGTNPEQAKSLVEATVNLFVQAGVVSKQRDSEEAGKFIESQIRSYEEKLVEAENKLKNFKTRNFGASGLSSQDYFTRVSMLSEEVNKLQVDLEASERSLDTYRRALESEVSGPRGGPSTVALDYENRIEMQQKQLDGLLQKFTEVHPDVVNTRRVIAQLKTELNQHRELERRQGDSVGKDWKGSQNPVYQKLKISQAETEAQVASLRSQLKTKKAALEQARAIGDQMPQVEAELAQLNRDYDVIRKNYEVMVARREAALLGARLNESSQLAEFRIVEPPKVSSSPVFPSKTQLSLLSGLAILVLSVGAALGVGYLRPTVDSIVSLRKLSKRPVLGSVSQRAAVSALSRQRSEELKFFGVVGLLVAIQAVWVAWVIMHQ